MALGVPVITTTAPGCIDTIKHDVHGYLVPPHDIYRLFEAMKKIADNTHLLESMSMNCYTHALSTFDTDVTVPKFLSIINK